MAERILTVEEEFGSDNWVETITRILHNNADECLPLKNIVDNYSPFVLLQKYNDNVPEDIFNLMIECFCAGYRYRATVGVGNGTCCMISE